MVAYDTFIVKILSELMFFIDFEINSLTNLILLDTSIDVVVVACSWDRWVLEDQILKNNDASRALQSRLYQKAIQ